MECLFLKQLLKQINKAFNRSKNYRFFYVFLKLTQEVTKSRKLKNDVKTFWDIFQKTKCNKTYFTIISFITNTFKGSNWSSIQEGQRTHIIVAREYRTYRVVTTSCLKAPRHLVVHNNLKTFTKYSERSVQNIQHAILVHISKVYLE